MKRPAALLAATALGALQTLAYVHTAAWPLPLATVALLAVLAARSSVGGAAAIGLAYGTAWLGAGTWWLYVSLHDYGGLPAWMAVAAVAGLSAFLSLYLAAAAALFVRWRHGTPGRDALLFAALWLLAELARGVIFTGFPWLASGYAQVDSPLAALAPWIGVYGIGAVGTGFAAWLGLALARRRGGVPAIAFAVMLVATALLGPGDHTTPAGSLSVTLLQGNVPQDEKFEQTAIPEQLAWAGMQLLAARGDLVVGPETLIPVLPYQLDPVWWQGLVDHFRQGRQAALIGLPLGDERVGYTNSVAGLSAATRDAADGWYRYDKHHLVPFGEFVPTGFHWFTQLMNIPLGDFDRGPVGEPSFAFHGQRIAPNICYEDLFGEELAARFVDAAQAPTLFANLSNIGWFGDTIAIDQHLQISRMRALEFQRPMIRATNTGATVAIDHTGRVIASRPRFTQGTLEAAVEGRSGSTPFAWWAARFGLWPLLGLALATIVATSAGPRRKRP